MRAGLCCLCSQIKGVADGDLIAALLPDQPYFRRILLETDAFAAMPSLGQLVPGHSLLCPREHIRSLSELDRGLHSEFGEALSELGGALRDLYGSDIHTFEHGAAKNGSKIICTVDHAHLHVLPLPSAVEIALGEEWAQFDGSLATLAEICGGAEYAFYTRPGGAARVLASTDRGIESQHVRRLIAAEIGRGEHWNWREGPDARSADLAWRRFESR